ncbi:MAG: hypothetical protein ACOYN2_00020 [Patescibacteria group bacterium]
MYCSSYLNKAVREMNLQYIQDADTKYFQATGKHAKDAKTLFDQKYMNYLPRDYQKGGADSEIIYVWNEESQSWDFEMGKY